MTTYANVIAHSIHPQTKRELITFEISFARYVLAELNTHKMISKNGSSSRAIPLKTAIQTLKEDTLFPVNFGKNQAGMQSSENLSPELEAQARQIWIEARDDAIKHAERLGELGVHKQFATRLIEPFSYQKMVITATSFDNFYWLRSHEAAQPEIRLLSDTMIEAIEGSVGRVLHVGDWHTPYYKDGVWTPEDDVPLQDALKISASCCAQTSYRKSDDSLEKAELIFEKLGFNTADVQPGHFSPCEHQGTPVEYQIMKDGSYWAYHGIGVSHIFKDGRVGSGNFEDFIQYRKTFPNENHTKYEFAKA